MEIKDAIIDLEESQIAKIDDAISIIDIVKNPDSYPDEAVAAAFRKVKIVNENIYQIKKILQGKIIERMTSDGATKMRYVFNGETRELTLGSGDHDPVDNAQKIWEKAGFPISEIGEIRTEPVFKGKWSTAKNTMKSGGPKKVLIEKLFPEGPKKLTDVAVNNGREN